MNFRKIKFKKSSNSKLLRKFLHFNFAKFMKLKFGFLNGDGYRYPLALLSIILYTLSLTSIAILSILLLPLQYLVLKSSWRHAVRNALYKHLTELWVLINHWIFQLTCKTKLEVVGEQTLSEDNWYCIMANHQSWVDILLMGELLRKKTPPLRFFMKQELIWQIPIVGIACWALGYPFMKRYSRAYLQKHPEKRGQDLETTKRFCQKFKTLPISICNYAEGTRFTSAKHKRQQSNYTHLLKPRAGGIAFVLAAMDGMVKHLVDVTMVYHHNKPNTWNFLCGRINKITLHYQVIPITTDLIGDYNNDSAFRNHFQQWINQRWEEKDLLIDTIKHDSR